MAHHKSAKKRIRQTEKRTERNKSRKTSVRTVVKNLRVAISENRKEDAQKFYNKAQSLLSKLAQKGLIKSNTAARKTSRLSQQVNQL